MSKGPHSFCDATETNPHGNVTRDVAVDNEELI